MIIGIPKEIEDSEKRVAATPETVRKMIAAGLSVSIEQHAGETSFFSDQEYEAAGASIVPDAKNLYGMADVILKIGRPTHHPKFDCHEIDLFKENSVLICLLQPSRHKELVEKMVSQKLTVFAIDQVPRIARAQKMDVLSSQSNLAGYKATIMAADRLNKIMPMMITAAGTVTPARVLILGAGVAGLQAIATAQRLGAVVKAFDTRPVVKEQVESLGAHFLQFKSLYENTEDEAGYAKALATEEHEKEQEFITEYIKEADIVITTALIPGKPAPLLISQDTVKGMKPGSVIVDLAVEAGGNCELSEAGKEVVKYGVTIIGNLNVPSAVATHASQLFARNVLNLLLEIWKTDKLVINREDQIVKATLVAHQGEIMRQIGVAEWKA